MSAWHRGMAARRPSELDDDKCAANYAVDDCAAAGSRRSVTHRQILLIAGLLQFGKSKQKLRSTPETSQFQVQSSGILCRCPLPPSCVAY